jgi:primosomal protein N' (replication factor Y) (superfamily II helicase)
MIIEVALPTPLRSCFDYLPPVDNLTQKIIVGARVCVPFGKRKMVGVVVNIKQTSQLSVKQLKNILEVIDDEAILPPKLLELVQWASDYYHHSLGEVLFTALPMLLRKGKKTVGATGGRPCLHVSAGDRRSPLQNALQLNVHQQIAIDIINAALHHFQTFLLHGVTGSGKTEIYLQVIEQVLKKNKQALVLVPEIGLTPQTVARFRERFAVPIVMLHSALTDKERLIAWSQAKEGGAAIVIGTRSAVFTPLAKAGVIIIDEEHDLSFKQQEGFRYNARDVAVLRGRLENIPVVLGSATPALESFYNVEQQRYQLLSLPTRVNAAALPQVTVIDVRNQKLNNGLSAPLLAAIEKHLADNGQVLLFVNRRGFAPLLLCHACGWIASCTRCDTKLVYHRQPPMLQCHHCTQTRAIDQHCPACQSHNLSPIGLGTQRIEQVLTQHFPDTGIVRIDRDSTRRKGMLHTMLDEIHDGKHRILLGTQMITKGHHFPALTLVAVLDADVGLFSADFRAAEHAAQLLLQVAGRAGRADRAGEVIIQTYNPQHVLLQQLLTQDYARFAAAVLQERRATRLPPFSHFAMLRAEATTKEQPLLFLKQVRALVQNKQAVGVELLGPIPSLIERKAGRYRAQLLLQAPQRTKLHQLLNYLITEIPTLSLVRRVRWSLDVDPQETI